MGVFFMFGVVIGILVSVFLLVAQAILYRKGIKLTDKIEKISKRKTVFINPVKEHRAKKIFEEL